MSDRQRTVQRRDTAFGAVAVAALVAMIVCQVVSGLMPGSTALTGVIVVLLAGCAVCWAARAWSPGAAFTGFGAAVLIGYAAEWIGVRTGFPFGAYHYTGLLWPQVGGVPFVVALAWGGMGLAAYAVVSAITRGGPGRIVLGALALTAWDLFLDPQMLRQNLWVWADPGPYRGVPLSNFAGWLLTSALVMAVLHLVAGKERPSTGLITLYTVMAVMETVAFAAVFEPRDPLVALAGGVAMGTFAVLAWRARWPR